MVDGLGIGYNPHQNDEEGARRTAFPSVLTPTAGVSFNVLQAEEATVRLASQISLPRFQNFRANLGLSVSMQDVVTAQIRVPEIVQEIRAGARSIPVPDALVWDGRRDDGRIAADGEYRYFVEAWDQLGGRTQSDVRTVVLDTTPPALEADADVERVFAPVAETGRKTLSIRQSGERVPLLVAAITAADGNLVRTLEWTDQAPEDLVWDGTDDGGSVVSDGVFQYRVTATDRAGNRAVRVIDNIVVASERVGVFVTANRPAFSPNDDGVADTVTFSVIFTTTEELIEWELSVIDRSGAVVTRWEGTGPPATGVFEWDGEGAADGTFRPRLNARFAFGQAPEATGSEIVLDTTPPEVSLSMQPRPFSPDGDGVEDDLRISLEVRNQTAIDRWQVEIFDPQGRLFHEFGGRGEPRRDYRWNGVSSTTGRLVDSATEYRVVTTVRDEVGNVGITEGSALVDILVLRDGDRLFIRVGNINFAPNSPQFITDDPELTRRNLEILNRLAEILTRFDRYAIQIEGHAVNITGTVREHEQTLVPLSTARAEAIRDALVDRGINPRRLSVLGRGGNEPLVPHTDLDERWRNRHVEFVLVQ